MTETQDEMIADPHEVLAALRRERDAAMAREQALADVLRVINASPGELQPVFDTMLEKAMALCGAAFGTILTFDGTDILVGTSRGWPEAFRAWRASATDVVMSGGPMDRLRKTKSVVHILDQREEPNYGTDPVMTALADIAGARTIIYVPLIKDEAAIGAISVFRQEARAFSDRQIALLESFAAQAVIVMANARLISEQREALERQTATAEILRVISQSPTDVRPVFNAIVLAAVRLIGCDMSFVMRTDGVTVSPAAAATRAGLVSDLGPLGTSVDPDHNFPSRAVVTKQMLYLPDWSRIDLPDHERNIRDMFDIGSALYLPLLREDECIGLLTLGSARTNAFGQGAIALAESFRDQALIAIENTRLFNETREALERQTATAEVLQVINASPGDLKPVFDSMLERAVRLCGATYGSLLSFDGTRFFSESLRGSMDAVRYGLIPEPGSVFERIANGERVVHILDLADTDAYRDEVPSCVRMVEVQRARTTLWVALRKDEIVVGVFIIYRKEVRGFSDKQIGLLESFAAQAVIAMENARLIAEQRDALERQTATAEILRIISTSQGNLQPVFDAVLENGLRLTESEYGALSIFEPGRHKIVAVYDGRSEAEPPTPEWQEIPPGGPMARIAGGDRVVQIADLRDTEEYRNGVPHRVELVEKFAIRTCLWLGLRHDDAVLGAILIFRRDVRPFTDAQIALLENFAAQGVIAMENARLLNELRSRTEELAQREDELRITFENMGDGVAMFDETPRLVAYNRKIQEILELPDGVLAERLTYTEYIRYLAERGEFGESADPEAEIRRISRRHDEHYVSQRTRPNGRVIELRHNPVAGGGFVMIYADITERKRAEAEIAAARDAAEEAARKIEAAFNELKIAQANLVQAEKMASLGQLTAGIAHEIKNPLNFVNNFAELSVDLLGELTESIAPAVDALDEAARDDVEDLTATLTSNLRKITQHGKRADGIVRSMLEHSRTSTGERREVDLNVVVDEALNLAYHGVRAQDQTFYFALERDYAKELPPIELTPQDITRLLLNLFNNGFYAAKKRAQAEPGMAPTLKVSTRLAGDAIEIRVWDNGTGIPVEIRDKLFQPFFTTKPSGEGTGLGLSISYDIVTKQHRGTIAVDSTPGEFTEFTITLPLTRAGVAT
jgi:signal transduction histidine kinase